MVAPAWEQSDAAPTLTNHLKLMFVCIHSHQVVKRHSVPLGLNADRLHQHPHVLSGVAMDACCLPTFLPTRPSTCQSRTARRERTRLLDVSKVKMRTKCRQLKLLTLCVGSRLTRMPNISPCSSKSNWWLFSAVILNLIAKTCQHDLGKTCWA